LEKCCFKDWGRPGTVMDVRRWRQKVGGPRPAQAKKLLRADLRKQDEHGRTPL
jgi:hypothetical protein